MAQITLWGASYSDVPAVDLPTTGGGTSTFYEVSGSQTLTSNATYDVTTLEQVVVNVAGGGGSSQQILCGTSTPSSSTGNNGDIYMVMSSGGSLEAYPASFTSSGMSSTSNASKCIGVSAEDGSATGNMYSSGSGTTGVVEYAFDLSSIPSNVTVESVACVVKAHEENSSRSTFTLQLYSGSTAKGSETTVSGTSNSTYNLTTGSWSRSELDSLVLHTEYGYYGGLVAGATLTITYTTGSPAFEVTLDGTASGWSITGSNIYQKSNGAWSAVTTATLDTTITKA